MRDCAQRRRSIGWAWTAVALLGVPLGLGCAVGETGDSFNASVTFGNDSSMVSDTGATSSNVDDDDDATDTDGATSVGPGGGDASDGAGGTAAGDDSSGGGGEGPSCVPEPELCDFVDNDCDGTVDNDPTDAGAPCDTGMPGQCADGVSTCTAGVLECVVSIGSAAETCDGIDNDCDGTVDNGNPGGGAACMTGMLGICGPGTQTCSGGALACTPNMPAAGAEVCSNGLDDNCNGSVDEGCSTCSHDICVTGAALVNGCELCVSQICASDPFCCSNSWDSVCVGEVGSICGLVC